RSKAGIILVTPEPRLACAAHHIRRDKPMDWFTILVPVLLVAVLIGPVMHQKRHGLDAEQCPAIVVVVPTPMKHEDHAPEALPERAMTVPPSTNDAVVGMPDK